MGMLMSEISAATVSEWLKNYSAVISEHANELTDLDRQIGDADHGIEYGSRNDRSGRP